MQCLGRSRGVYVQDEVGEVRSGVAAAQEEIRRHQIKHLQPLLCCQRRFSQFVAGAEQARQSLQQIQALGLHEQAHIVTVVPKAVQTASGLALQVMLIWLSSPSVLRVTSKTIKSPAGAASTKLWNSAESSRDLCSLAHQRRCARGIHCDDTRK